ncbi:hypothetical protein VMCG_01805 [Cytospora schulzeri]|uniref:Uncharacterized protein n=1 Tax=Cytospora schulzeri TaxID=448051 RepID=A0A423X3Q0_9PEZI|nr:hypothetical protein VMCG_01805 [Valsa malicola]
MTAISKAMAKAAAANTTLPTIREIVSRLRVFSTCDVADALVRLGDKKGGFLHGISARTPGAAPGTPVKICGPAVTIRMCNYGGGLGQALKPFVEYNEPGKIMIIETPDGKAAKISACWGSLETARAKILQAEGVIVSGNVRQVSDCNEMGLPIFSRGTAALGTREHMRLAKANETITIGGVDVRSDDMLLADENGVVVIRYGRIQEVLESCEYGVRHDKAARQAISSGSTMKEALRHARYVSGLPVERIGPLRL